MAAVRVSSPIPEPPDGTRLEWVYDTDLYAARRDDAESEKAGWKAGDGGQVWVVYPGSVPLTWEEMVKNFGESLRSATWLAPVIRVKTGDQYVWNEGFGPVYVLVRRVARDGSWANIQCRTARDAKVWTERQSLPFPPSFELVVAEPADAD